MCGKANHASQGFARLVLKTQHLHQGIYGRIVVHGLLEPLRCAIASSEPAL